MFDAISFAVSVHINEKHMRKYTETRSVAKESGQPQPAENEGIHGRTGKYKHKYPQTGESTPF